MRKKHFVIQLHHILSIIAGVTLFVGFAGIAGTIDTDTTTTESCIWAAVFMGIGGISAYFAYREAGGRRGR